MATSTNGSPLSRRDQTQGCGRGYYRTDSKAQQLRCDHHEGSRVFGSDPTAQGSVQNEVGQFILKCLVLLVLVFFAAVGSAHVCFDLYDAIRRWWARRQQAREQWIEMPQEEEERDPNGIPGMFGEGSPMRRPQYIPLQQVYTAHRGQRVRRSREYSSLSEVPPDQVYAHYMCSLCSEEPTVIQARR